MSRRIPVLAASAVLVAAGLVVLTTSPSEATGGWHSASWQGSATIGDGGSPCRTSYGSPRDVNLTMQGLPAEPLADIRITGLTLTHDYVGDLQVELIDPEDDYYTDIFNFTGAYTGNVYGDGSSVAGPYSFRDDATPPYGGWWEAAEETDSGVAIPAGSYFATTQGGTNFNSGIPISLRGQFSGVTDPNGTWTLRFIDGCAGSTGVVTGVTLEMRTVSQACTDEQADVAVAQGAVTTATAAATQAQAAETTAQTALTAATTALADAKTAVSKATKALKKAKKATKHRAKKVARATKRLARSKVRLVAATLTQSQAQTAFGIAHERTVAAGTTVAVDQVRLTDALGNLQQCQAE